MHRTAGIFRAGGTWCYGLFVSGGFDHSDTIGCDDAATMEEAAAALRETLPPGALEVVRLADIPGPGMGGY